MSNLRNTIEKPIAKNQEDIESPKVIQGTPIMLTLAPTDNTQYYHVLAKNRLIMFKANQSKTIEPILKQIFSEYTLNLEISETLASDGHKAPRLHYHIIGVVKDPFKMWMLMGELVHKHQIGYHIKVIESKEEHEYYNKYVIKQDEIYKTTNMLINNRKEHKNVP